ncbi:hypothetical protein YC2023_083267 [Brassica napus]
MAAHQDVENETTNRNCYLSKLTRNKSHQTGTERFHLLHTLMSLQTLKGPHVQPKKSTSPTAKPDPYSVETPPPSETTSDLDLFASRGEYELSSESRTNNKAERSAQDRRSKGKARSEEEGGGSSAGTRAHVPSRRRTQTQSALDLEIAEERENEVYWFVFV